MPTFDEVNEMEQSAIKFEAARIRELFNWRFRNRRRRCCLSTLLGNRSSRPKVISPEVISPETWVMSPEIHSQVAPNFNRVYVMYLVL